MLEVQTDHGPTSELGHEFPLVLAVTDHDVHLGGVHGELGETAHRQVVGDDELSVNVEARPKCKLPVVVLQRVGVSWVETQDLSLVRVVAEPQGDTRVPLEPGNRPMRELGHERPLTDANRSLLGQRGKGGRDPEVGLTVSSQQTKLEAPTPPGASQGGVEEQSSQERRPLRVLVVGHATDLSEDLERSVLQSSSMHRIVLHVISEPCRAGVRAGIVGGFATERIGPFEAAAVLDRVTVETRLSLPRPQSRRHAGVE